MAAMRRGMYFQSGRVFDMFKCYCQKGANNIADEPFCSPL